MNNGEHTVQYPKTWIVLGGIAVAVLVIIVAVVAYNGFFPQGNNITKTTAAPPLTPSQNISPTSRETTRAMFGPWHLNVNSGTGAPYLVMLDSGGGVEVSSKVVHIGSDWQVATPPGIEAELIGPKTVTIQMGGFDNYTLSYNQAFVFASQPGTVYDFRSDGTGRAQLFSTSIKALKH